MDFEDALESTVLASALVLMGASDPQSASLVWEFVQPLKKAAVQYEALWYCPGVQEQVSFTPSRCGLSAPGPSFPENTPALLPQGGRRLSWKQRSLGPLGGCLPQEPKTMESRMPPGLIA